MFDLTGKVGVVTGGASGIGAAIAQRFLRAGMSVVVADVTEGVAEEVASWGAHFVRTDVSETGQVGAMLDEAISRFGALDVLVNNAGIAVTGGIEATGSDAARRLHEVNTVGILNGVREGAARMTKGGAIINMASQAGIIGMPGLIEYSMSKAAIVMLSRVAAIDLGPRNIRVNSICPGLIVTPLAERTGAPITRTAKMITALGRAGTPEDVAAVAHFLASDDASYITGQALCTEGGWNVGTTQQIMEAGLAAA